MAIKVVVKGQTKFTQKCPICGCVYTYELEDLHPLCSSVGVKYTECPKCKYHVSHKEFAPINNPFKLPLESDDNYDIGVVPKPGSTKNHREWPFDDLDVLK